MGLKGEQKRCAVVSYKDNQVERKRKEKRRRKEKKSERKNRQKGTLPGSPVERKEDRRGKILPFIVYNQVSVVSWP